jgi:N-acetylglutamate synthase-like GNAT family acetyltransferase
MKIRIRKAAKKDLTKILNLFNSSSNLTGDDKLHYKKYHIKEYIEGPIFNTYIAEINKEIAGVILIIIFKKAKYLFIENLIVKEDFRKQGIGSKLIGHVESLAKKYKIKLIYFYSEENNTIIKNFSENNRFKKAKKFCFFWKEIK